MKQRNLWRTSLAIFLVLGLVAAACGNDDRPPAAQEAGMAPGEGVSVTMARGDFSTGYMQAAIYHHLLEELGYDVSEPAHLELSPATAYLGMADGTVDFWANSWFSNHDPFMALELPDGSLVQDHVSVVGEEMLAGGLEGLVTNKSLVDEHGIETFDQIVNDDVLFELYESADLNPGDGVLQIFGCVLGWGCRLVLDETLELAGYAGRVEQVEVAGYEPVFAEILSRAEDGTPFISYIWTPSGYIAKLIPGVHIMWLAHDADKVHDGSTGNPGFAVTGPAALGPQVCTNDPCYLFRNPADIVVTANNDFLADNPAAAKLLELVKIDVVDVASQNLLYDNGEDTTDDVNRHAAQWIAAHRGDVDEWLAQARAAA